MAKALATEDVLKRFLDRIARSLEHEPIELDLTTHRLRFADALGRCSRGNHYEVLEVAPGAGEPEVHAAYEVVARLVHPTHATRLGLAGRQGVTEVVFERATEAYLVLSDPHRRSRYDRDEGLEVRRSPAQRAKEAKRIARELYTRAQGLVEREDYHYALELLQQAVLADPSVADCWALLGRCRAQNPKWLHMAADNLRRAIQLSPEASELRLELAEVEEGRGNGEEAARLYREVLARAPDNTVAQEALERLEGGGSEKSRRRWWGW